MPADRAEPTSFLRITYLTRVQQVSTSLHHMSWVVVMGWGAD